MTEATQAIEKLKATTMGNVNLGWGGGSLMKQTGSRSKEMQRLEMIRNAITILRIHGYMPQSQSNKLREKLMREIRTAVEALEKANG